MRRVWETQGRKGKRPPAGNPTWRHPSTAYAPGETLLFEVKKARDFIKFDIPALRHMGYTVSIPLLPTEGLWNSPSSYFQPGRALPMYTPQIGCKRRQIFTSPSMQGNVSGLCWSFPLLRERTPASPNQAQKLLIFKKDWAFSEQRGHVSACLHDCSTKRNCCKGRL